MILKMNLIQGCKACQGYSDLNKNFMIAILWKYWPQICYMSFEWLIEDQAFSAPHDLAPSPQTPPSPVSKLSLFFGLPVCRRSSFLTGEEVRRWGRSQIIRQRRESLLIYKSFNIPWCIFCEDGDVDSPEGRLSPLADFSYSQKAPLTT